MLVDNSCIHDLCNLHCTIYDAGQVNCQGFYNIVLIYLSKYLDQGFVDFVLECIHVI